MNELNKDLKINIPEVTEFFKGAKKISFANIADTSLLKSLSPVKVVLNGRKLSFAQRQIIENGRVMVPLRTFFEELGYDVAWNGKTKTAEASNGNNVITVKINSNEITYNKGTYSCDTVPRIISGRTLVPVRAISECTGCGVNRDDKTKTIYIISQ